MPAVLRLPNTASCPFDQVAEDNEEMVYKRVREDGVSKRDKLRTDSRRARLAAIPSRTVTDGKLTMQIKGRAVASSQTDVREQAAPSIKSGKEGVSNVDRVETGSQNSHSPSHKTPTRTNVSTKATLGNLYPPLSPSNTSNASKMGLQVIAPTDIGPRSSTPSQQHKSTVSSAIAPNLPSPTTDMTRNSASCESRLPQAGMRSAHSVATSRMLDPYDDDADDDAMRRLCRSPVLLPNGSITATLLCVAGTSGRQSNVADASTSTPATITSEVAPQESILLADVGEKAHGTSPMQGYSTASAAADEMSLKRSAQPDQQVNRSLGELPNNAGLATARSPNATSHVESGNQTSVPPTSCSFKSPEVDIQPSIPVVKPSLLPSPSQSTNPRPSLAAHVALLEASLSSISFQDLRAHIASRTGSSQTPRHAPVSPGSISSNTLPRTSNKLDDYISQLEAVLSGNSKSLPVGSVSALVSQPSELKPSSIHNTVSQVRVPQKAVVDAPEFSVNSQLTSRPDSTQHFIPARRNSSASSESYEPASPARTTTPEFEDFAPGEFVVSAEVLNESTISLRPLQHVQEAKEALVKKKEQIAEVLERPADIPQLSARELPPNMPVPAMNGYYGKAATSARLNEAARVQPPPPTLRHPQPRRGTSTPTAYTLEESAAAKNAQMIHLTVEYEEIPVDIAARIVKPAKESVTKVKFAAEVEEAAADTEEGVRHSSPSESSSLDVTNRTRLDSDNIATSTAGSDNPTAQFKFVETDILKGLSMPSLARRSSYTSSETSDSESQPGSPVENAKELPTLAKKPFGYDNDVRKPVKLSLPPTSSSPLLPESEASSRSTSPAENPAVSGQSDSDNERCASSAASRMTAPAIRVGGSLTKKEGMKPGFLPQRSSNRYGIHAGYSGPKRSFRTFEYPSHIAPDSGWRGSDGVVHGTTAVHPETAYDIAQEQGGQAALATFLENYETPLKIVGARNSALIEQLIPETATGNRGNSKIATSTRPELKGEAALQVNDRSELDIFDDLLI